MDQDTYNTVCGGLDAVMALAIQRMGLSEGQARVWLREFVHQHYLPVWRSINERE